MPFALRSVTASVMIAEMSTFGWVIVAILAVLGIWGLIGFMRFVGGGGDELENHNTDASDDYGGDDFGIFGGDDSGAGDFDKRP